MKLNKIFVDKIKVEVATKGCQGCIFDAEDRTNCMQYRLFCQKNGFIECTEGFIYVKGKRT